MDLSLVIPLFNESRRLERGLEGARKLAASLPGATVEILLVDDGSTDTTLEMARHHADVTTLALPHQGKGSAVRAGVLMSRGDRILVSDVDWSVPPEEAMRLLDVSADVVLAVREGRLARRIGEPPWRHWLGRAFNHYVRAMLPLEHADTQCGCKLFLRKPAAELFSLAQGLGWAWDVEVLLLARQLGLSVREVPVHWRFEEDSRLRPVRDGLSMAREVFDARRRLQGNGRIRRPKVDQGG